MELLPRYDGSPGIGARQSLLATTHHGVHGMLDLKNKVAFVSGAGTVDGGLTAACPG